MPPEEEPTTTTTVVDPPQDPETEPTGKVYTQAEVDALDIKARRSAEAAAKRKLAEELGVTVEEARALIEATRTAEQAQMTEAERLQAQARAALEQATQMEAQARAATLRADLTQALLAGSDDGPGVRSDRLAVAVTLALPVAAGSDDPDTAIAAAVEHVRATLPELFTPAPADPSDPQTPGTPGPARKLSERTPPPPAGAKLGTAYDRWKTRGKPRPLV